MTIIKKTERYNKALKELADAICDMAETSSEQDATLKAFPYVYDLLGKLDIEDEIAELL